MADLCDDFNQIPNLLALVPAKADIVCPSRYCKGGKQLLKPSVKLWLPKLAGILLSLFSGMPTKDPTNSFKIYNSKIFKQITLKSTISFSVTLEIIAKSFCLGFRILEIPTVWRDRTKGKSNFKVFESVPSYLKWFLLCFLEIYF